MFRSSATSETIHRAPVARTRAPSRRLARAEFDPRGAGLSLAVTSLARARGPRTVFRGTMLLIAAAAASFPLAAQVPWNISLTEKVTATDAQPNERFGQAVSASAGRVLVGTWTWDQPSGPATGTARVFSLVGGSLQQDQVLPITDQGPGDSFGNSVAIYGDVAVV